MKKKKEVRKSSTDVHNHMKTVSSNGPQNKVQIINIFLHVQITHTILNNSPGIKLLYCVRKLTELYKNLSVGND